jgi:hypothetical protein
MHFATPAVRIIRAAQPFQLSFAHPAAKTFLLRSTEALQRVVRSRGNPPPIPRFLHSPRKTCVGESDEDPASLS